MYDKTFALYSLASSGVMKYERTRSIALTLHPASVAIVPDTIVHQQLRVERYTFEVPTYSFLAPDHNEPFFHRVEAHTVWPPPM